MYINKLRSKLKVELKERTTTAATEAKLATEFVCLSLSPALSLCCRFCLVSSCFAQKKDLAFDFQKRTHTHTLTARRTDSKQRLNCYFMH